MADMTAYFNATDLRWATYYGGSWSSQASQGAYGQYGESRVGAMIFGGLRSGINWPIMEVKEVQLAMTFSRAGWTGTKTLGLYATTRSSVGGTGGSMLGTNLGQVSCGAAYDATRTVVINSTTYPAVFAKIADWIENGSTTGLALYINESVGSGTSWSANYLKITWARLTVIYDTRGSMGTLDPLPAQFGENLTLTIDPIEDESEVTHTAEFVCGNATSGVINIAGGVTTYDYTIPTSWIPQLAADTTEIEATCTLTTYVGGALRGYKNIGFVIQLPQSYAPVLNGFSVERYTSYIDDQAQTQYMPSLTGNHVWVNIDASMDLKDGANPGTATLRYWPTDDPETVTEINIPWTTDSLTKTNDRSIIPGVVSLSESFGYELVLTNGYYTESATSRIELSWAPFHIAGSGYGIGLGKYSDGTQSNPSIDIGWPLKMDTSAAQSIADIIYPVGSIYMSTQDSDVDGVELPELLFGGTWTKIEDKFLLSAGSTYTLGDDGGSATHSIPGHKHLAPVGTVNNNGAAAILTDQGTQTGTISAGRAVWASTNASGAQSGVTIPYTAENAGVDMNTMPPYLVVNVWQRTA